MQHSIKKFSTDFKKNLVEIELPTGATILNVKPDSEGSNLVIWAVTEEQVTRTRTKRLKIFVDNEKFIDQIGIDIRYVNSFELGGMAYHVFEHFF